nr:hypothetical protein [Cytobacillus kochii]
MFISALFVITSLIPSKPFVKGIHLAMVSIPLGKTESGKFTPQKIWNNPNDKFRKRFTFLKTTPKPLIIIPIPHNEKIIVIINNNKGNIISNSIFILKIKNTVKELIIKVSIVSIMGISNLLNIIANVDVGEPILYGKVPYILSNLSITVILIINVCTII